MYVRFVLFLFCLFFFAGNRPTSSSTSQVQRRFLYALRADVCKYRPVVGKMKISKNPKKIQWTTLGTLFMKI